MFIAICDDSKAYINTMEEYLRKLDIPSLEYDIFESGEELAAMYQNGQATYDAIFLDMEMKELDGIQTANLIREFDKQVLIIFVTSHTEYMQRSFECSPFRFLVKPLDLGNLEKTFDAICKNLVEEPQTIVFTTNRNRTRLFCQDIILFENQQHCIWIHTRNGKHKIYKSFSKLYAQLNQKLFVRVHKSFIINLDYIKKITDSDIILYDYLQPIPLSRTYKRDFMVRFLNAKERKLFI